MVCDHCSSASHVTGYQNCPKYCTVCKDVGHRRYSKACPNRTCTRCNTVGHSATECTFCSLCRQQGYRSSLFTFDAVGGILLEGVGKKTGPGFENFELKFNLSFWSGTFRTKTTLTLLNEIGSGGTSAVLGTTISGNVITSPTASAA